MSWHSFPFWSLCDDGPTFTWWGTAKASGQRSLLLAFINSPTPLFLLPSCTRSDRRRPLRRRLKRQR
ncbi:hypothetical protein KFK09_014758 [Dendrobium nobile]|uniref:Uncharacterized protein n=1 Tax=Dendrobium nobile TaxID=94219 RepID=A0A8T3B4A1_DENNO|nr:hypothetical protein KFK09_014758 [Dendrobium nobile]